MSWIALALATVAWADSQFDITISNPSTQTWSQGVLAVLPGSASPNALITLGPSPTSGDPYDTYTFIHQSCDPSGEDDGDGALLIARWSSLTAGENAWTVGPFPPGASRTVTITAAPGDVLSFAARVNGSGDDGVILHVPGDPSDATVDLFDGAGRALATIAFEISGIDVQNNGAACPPTGSTVQLGGNVGSGLKQTTPSTCKPVTWYADADADDFGDPRKSRSACNVPAGHVADATDCDDGDPDVNPDATEVCDGVDDDCDGKKDDADPDLDPATATLWYADGDDDGFGTGSGLRRCAQPAGRADAPGDCDDDDPAVNPDATEVCNGIDDDCDGAVDEDDAADAVTWFADLDGDTFGDPEVGVLACDGPSGLVSDGSDCDDDDPDVNPDAAEVCNAIDDDCDDATDEADPDLDASTAGSWYRDADGDGHGDDADSVFQCTPPPGHVGQGGDCDDARADVNPGADERCDGRDDDCDGDTDESDAVDVETWYDDGDGDGHGDPAASTAACDPPEGAVGEAGDCDDADPAVHPGAEERCDGRDEDCDGDTDEDPVDPPAWYTDADADGYGSGAPVALACGPVDGAVDADGDCDDADPAVHPGAPDTPGDGVDQDCDGSDLPGGASSRTWAPPEEVEPLSGCGCSNGGPGALPPLLGLLLLRRRRR